jgi:purine catabolism regulator
MVSGRNPKQPSYVHRMLTLDALLAQEEFALELVTGTDAGERPVAGAHTIEVANPVQWLPEGWVILTTGMRLRDRPAEQRRLIRQLRGGGVTALGFGAGVVLDDVPTALVEEAHRCSFPVFVVPLPTPFREIVRFVDGSLLSDDLYVLRRTVSMQRYLMEALATETPEEEVVRRLGSVLDVPVALFDDAGAVVARSRDADWSAVWASISTSDPDGRLEVAGRMLSAVPILARQELRYWLVSGSHADGAMGRLAAQVVDSARCVLQTAARAHEQSVREQRALRARLLRDLLTEPNAARPQPGEADLHARAASCGLDLRAPARAVVLAPAADRQKGSGQWRDRTRRAVARILALGHAPHLVGEHGGRVVAIVQRADEVDLDGLLAELTAHGLTAHCGIGRPLTSIGQAARSLADAELALEQARSRAADGGAPVAVRYEELAFTEWVLNQAAPQALRPRAEAALAALPEQPPLRDTLESYFEANLNVTATAKAMNLHPNSLRYRLARIEQLLGICLNSPADIAELYLALRVSAADGSSEPSAAQASTDPTW